MSTSQESGRPSPAEPALASVEADGSGRRIEQDGSTIELDAGVGAERPEWPGETDETADLPLGHADPERGGTADPGRAPASD